VVLVCRRQRAEQGEAEVQILPRLQLVSRFSRSWIGRLWYGSHIYSAGLSGGYGAESSVSTDRLFQQNRGDQAGVQMEMHGDRAQLFAGFSISRDEWSYTPAQLSILERMAQQQTWAVDLGVEQQLGRCFSLYGKFRHCQVTEADPLAPPVQQAWGYVQYHNIFFSHDLDARVRLGLTWLGERGAHSLLAGHVPATQPLAAAVAPFAYTGFKIKDVHLFFCLQNFLGIDYQTVAGFPMAKQQFRWGFVWDFNN